MLVFQSGSAGSVVSEDAKFLRHDEKLRVDNDLTFIQPPGQHTPEAMKQDSNWKH